MWTTPKTDWYGVSEDGVYRGDRFNAVDFNRIKKDFFYADEINKLEENLVTITSNTIKRSYGSAPTYVDNGNTMDFEELNRLEGAILDLYNRLTNQSEGRRMLTWNFGEKEGF